MKRTLITSLLVLGISTAATFADVAVYRGSALTKATSEAASGSLVLKPIEIIDLANNQMVTISTLKVFIKKFYKVGPVVSLTQSQVKDKRTGKVSTVFAYGSTASNLALGTTTVASLLESGVNGQVTIKGTDKVALPKLLKGTASLLVTAGTNTPSGLVTTAPILKLDDKGSRGFNDAGNSLTEVRDAIVQQLQDAGYDEENDLPSVN